MFKFFKDQLPPLLSDSVIALDIETTGLNPHKDKILSYAVSIDGESAYQHTNLHLLGELPQNSTIVLHNAKFDMHFLYRAGIDLRPHKIMDTMLLHHLIDENAPHALDSIVQFKYKDNYKEVFWGKYKKFEEAPEHEALEYAGKDVIYTWLLYHSFLSDLSGATSLVEHVHRLARALYDTEIAGLAIDTPYLMSKGLELKERIEVLKPEMRKLLNHEANMLELDMWIKEIEKRKTPKGKGKVPRPLLSFDSSKQLMALLYGSVGLPAQTNEKTKNPSVDDASLEKIKDLHPVVPLLQEYRNHNKVYTTYIEGTLEKMVDGRIYPTFNVNGTVTGRISSYGPNMQQLPREGGIRGMYIPDAGNKLISCDYSQLEVVVAAHFSMDPNLLKIVYDGASKHDITAHALGIDRQTAKTVNFAAQYQCSARKLSLILKISHKEGELVYNKYWETYAKEKEVIEECKRQVDAGRPIYNPFGRLRRFANKFETVWEKEAAYRQAYSSLIQGTGSDCTHWAFYTISAKLKEKNLGRALFEVHDEILIQAQDEVAEHARALLSETMVEAGQIAKLRVPLSVDCSDPLERWEK